MYPIIFIGPNKTGTTSLAHIMRYNYGFKTVHYPKHYGVIPRLNDKELIEYLSRHQAWLDGNWWNVAPRIKKLIPEATLIHTTRDYEKWLNSRTVHVLHNRLRGDFPWTQINYKEWEREWKISHLVSEALGAPFIDITGETNNPGIKGLHEIFGPPKIPIETTIINTSRERFMEIMEIMNITPDGL